MGSDTILAALIPASLSLGLLGLGAFIWSLRARQYDDLEGDRYRALFGGNDQAPRAAAPADPDRHSGA